MHYQTYELTHALVAPWRSHASALWHFLDFPLNPGRRLPFSRMAAASCEVFGGLTKRYGKPEWGIVSTRIFGLEVPVHEEIVRRTPFCDLLHFDRDERVCGKRYDPKVLMVAPLSGHYATLLRGTVQAMIHEHNLYITHWRDARDVPLAFGRFDLDDFIDP
jgi:poly(3-hydroxybutyrate) depolymerase